MNNRKQGACGRVDIGGQAVLEGVMMKAPDAIAISVRRPNGTIVTRRTPYVPLSKKHPWMGWPIVRGIVNFVTMLSMGMSVLQQSTDMLGMLDEEPSKFEKWLSQKLGKGIDKIVMAVAIVLAGILSIGLFFVIPELFARLLKAWMPDPSSNWLINLLSGILRILILIGYILFCAKVPDVRRPCPEQRLVPVKEKLSARAHSVQHLQLGAGDVFPRAEGFQVRRADIGNDCDIRTRRARQGGYLAARAHAHFQHCRAHVGSDARHAKRHPDDGIEVSLPAKGRECRPQYGGTQCLGGGLADAPGDGNHAQRR